VSLLLVAVVLAAGVGCARAPTSEPDVERSADEMLCARALLQLDQRIASCEKAGAPAAVIVEAREIYRMSRELYLQRDYELALQLIEEGMRLFEN